MGTIDMPSQVDKIAEITQNGGNIYLVGYSMGTTVSLLYCATNVSHCQNNVKGIIALAPAANLNRVEQPVLYLISLVELLPGIQKIPFDFLLEICQHAPGIGLCDVLFQALLGPSNPNILPQLLPILTYTGNCPVTNKVVNHYAQIINSQGKFRWYDYGYLENFSRYGTFSPPYYETSKIPVQTTLISANKDIITTEPDIEVLYSSLSATKRTWYKLPENSAPAILMNHVDFITGAEVQREQLYSKINAALGDCVLGDLYPDNNVCPTILDYDTIYVNDRCWYDPDVTASVPEIISNHGLSSTSYNVTTWDGYTIEIFRITPLVNTTTKGSILFFPALTRDCRSFLLQGANSLAIYYAYKGWDVWLGNPRGSEYSSNIHFTKDDDRFWDYSFHEMGTIDMPSQVDKIAEITQNSGNIYLIGHSMGTTASFVYCTTNVSHCQNNVKGIIALAANLYRGGQTLFYLLSLAELLQGIIKIEIDSLVERCQNAPGIGICYVLLQDLSGPTNPNILPQLLPIATYTGNCPITKKNVNHAGQIINSQGKFRWYDYGYLENFRRYGTSSPPYYVTSNIPVHTTLISANKDTLTTEPDIEVLYSLLSETKRTWYKLPENSDPDILMNHADFLTGAEVQRQQLYSKINAALGDV
ncbi:unnamed protein product [Brassicogethes aeneus]|uniref:AB hydrolase-1 domain-containing protein n=1 Tax=Brassicogethes aeneus TaxID=1431903 RepID=A0A9P0B2U8_BRAAE|nr:unnamed protein product [Brassicogethes aeneus]